MPILAIDPGNIESAYVLATDDLSKVISKDKLPNEEIRETLFNIFESVGSVKVAIEMIASYGMPVGETVFQTCLWIGRFIEIVETYGLEATLIYRKDEKMCLCHSMKAKDSNIRQALIDMFGVVGTKSNPGYFYGFKKDIWAAMAVAVTYHKKYLEE